MVEWTLVYLYNTRVFSDKKNELQMYSIELKWTSRALFIVERKSTSKSYVLYDFAYLTFLKWKKTIEMDNRLVVARGEGWGWGVVMDREKIEKVHMQRGNTGFSFRMMDAFSVWIVLVFLWLYMWDKSAEKFYTYAHTNEWKFKNGENYIRPVL